MSLEKTLFARSLRKQQSIAESLLWTSLRSRRLCGYKFHRQYVIGPYIVDFVCFEKYLVVEVDGAHHLNQVAYDQKRTDFLKSKGYREIRIWAHDVVRQRKLVLEGIFQLLEQTILEAPHPARTS